MLTRPLTRGGLTRPLVRGLLGLPGGTTPTDPLAGFDLAAWYSAGDAGTMFNAASGGGVVTDGEIVRRFEDKSGNGNHLIESSTDTGPVYEADGFMGLAGVRLSASAMKTLESVILGGGEVSVFAFAQMDSAAAPNARLISFQGGGESFDYTSPQSGIFIGLDGSATKVAAYRGGWKSETAQAQGYFGEPNYGNFFRFGSVFDGVNHTLYLNGAAQAPASSIGDFSSPGTLHLGSSVGGTDNWGGLVREILVIRGTVSPEDIALIDRYFQSAWTKVVTTEGDSLVYGISIDRLGIGYVYQALPDLSPSCNLHNVAIGGSRLNVNPGDVVDRTSNVYGQIPAAGKGGKRYIYYLAIGHNDCEALDDNAQQTAWISALESNCLATIAAGYDGVVVATILPRSDAGTDHNTNRAAINPMIRAMAATNGFTVADYAAHPVMGIDSASDNETVYSPDKIHPNEAGNALLSPIFAEAINNA